MKATKSLGVGEVLAFGNSCRGRLPHRRARTRARHRRLREHRRRVAQPATNFKMSVVDAAHKEFSVQRHWASSSFDGLLATADIATLHLPLTPSTNGCIRSGELARMKTSAFLINTAPGALIDPVALRETLAAKRIAGFAADLPDAEPPAAEDPLLRSERVPRTSHVPSLTAAACRAMCIETATNVLAVLRGAAPAAPSVLLSQAGGEVT